MGEKQFGVPEPLGAPYPFFPCHFHFHDISNSFYRYSWAAQTAVVWPKACETRMVEGGSVL